MSLLRAATTTRIDEELSPGNVTAIHGETALLACKVLNVGDKAVSRELRQKYGSIDIQLADHD